MGSLTELWGSVDATYFSPAHGRGTDALDMSHFYVGAGYPNSGPQAWPSPQAPSFSLILNSGSILRRLH